MFLILWQSDATKDDVLQYPCKTLSESIEVLEALKIYHEYLKGQNVLTTDYMYTFQKYNHLRGVYEEWVDQDSGINDPIEFNEYLKGGYNCE